MKWWLGLSISGLLMLASYLFQRTACHLPRSEGILPTDAGGIVSIIALLFAVWAGAIIYATWPLPPLKADPSGS